MSSWSFDMIRQSGWDLWVLVCVAGSLVLASYILLGKVWTTPRGRLTLMLGSAGILGTAIIVALPALHEAKVGLVWTFALLSILSATFYLNLREQLSLRQTAILLSMRVTALALLVPMLFEPVVRFIMVPRPERPLIFLVDTSGSMSFPDVQNGPTRLQSVWQALRPELDTIKTHFVPSYFTFDSSCRPLKAPEDLARLQADGKSTDVVTAVTTALSKTTREDAAIVLLTDGIDNTSPNAADAVRASALPIHTIRVGSDQAEPASVANVAVDNIESPDDFAVNHDTTIKATIKSTALANRVVEVKMSEIGDDNKPIGELKTQKLVLQPTPEGQIVEFAFKPTTVGLHRGAVWIDPVAGERSTADNRQEFQGLAIDPRIKVLYIEGSIRQEYQATRRAFSADANIELATFLRKSQNAGKVDVEAAGTVDGEPFKGLPTSADGWKKFDVVVIGDVDRGLLLSQERNIEQRVAGGGGLIMLGGTSSFGPGGYAGSPLENALPVFMFGDKNSAQDKSRFVPRLTADGLTHPIMDGLTDWFGVDDKPAAKTLPPLNGNVIVGKPKTGAQVLLVHRDRTGPDGNPEIVLAVQRYGEGRSAAFTLDTTYLWYLPLRGMGQDSPFNRLWGQMIRWLGGQDVRDRQRGAGIEALINKSNYQLGENVKLRVRVRDERGDATSHAQVSVTFTNQADNKSQTLQVPANDSQQGLYELIVPNPDKGDYSMEVVAAKDGKELGRRKLAFTVIPPADEMLKIAANPQLLTAIANETHGLYYELGQFPQFIDQLIRSDPKFGQPQQRSVPLDDYIRDLAILAGTDPQWNARYDLPIQAGLMVLLLASEWILRRQWQLP
jgi:uncharacterized membrane protein